MKLSKIFKTQDSFARSVNLGSDIHNKKLSNQYIWGSSTLKIFSQILDELRDETKQGAVTLTGPFGTGKSAFTLQLLQLFGSSDSELKEQALNRLSSYQPDFDFKSAHPKASQRIRDLIRIYCYCLIDCWSGMWGSHGGFIVIRLPTTENLE